MNQFVRETGELWYWSFFCPSKLQQRMNEWTGFSYAEYKDILLEFASRRFLVQFFLLVVLHCVPLIIALATYGQAIDWLFLPVAIVSAYGMGVLWLPTGMSLPLLFWIAYLIRPIVINTVLNATIAVLAIFLSPIPQLAQGLGIGFIGVIITTLVGLKMARYTLWQTFVVGGTALSIATGMWFTTHNSAVTIASGILVGLLVFLLQDDIVTLENTKETVVLLVTTIILTIVALFLGLVILFNVIMVFNIIGGTVKGIGFIVLFTVFIITEGVLFYTKISETGGLIIWFVLGLIIAILTAIILTAPLPLFLLATMFVALTLSSSNKWWLGFSVAGMMAIGGLETYGFLTLLAIPAMLIGFYRLFPFYPVLALMTGWRSLLSRRFDKTGISSLRWLRRLPPHLDELVWLPLPGHARLLVIAFQSHTSSAIETWQQMQSSPLWGFQFTAKRALPTIITNQLQVVTTTDDLIRIATPKQPILPLLVPSYYQQEGERQRSNIREIDTLLPTLFARARDVQAAITNTNIALRERGVKNAREQIVQLQAQLPGMGLSSQARQRWRPVLEQWLRVLEQEIAHEGASSDVINPFQTGNPLTIDRDDLFKGRTHLANEVVRRLLDRSRPTLMLHGPRRCGKSSFLKNMPRLLSSDVLPIYLDMQDESVINSDNDFCYSLVRSIRRDVQSQRGLELPFIAREKFEKNPYPMLQDWIDETLPRLKPNDRLLICLDEFEVLGYASRQGRVTDRLFNQLRHLIQHAAQMNFLFCGVQTLEELGPSWSSYFISVYPLEIHPYLEESEARELLLRPDPEFNMRYDDGVIDAIIAQTRCQPYLVQIIGEALVVRANLDGTTVATQAMLTKALESALTAGGAYFDNLWTEYTGTTDEEVAAGQRMLLALAREGRVPAPDSAAAEAALRRLLRFHTIEEHDGNYRFEVAFVERWVRERARPTAH